MQIELTEDELGTLQMGLAAYHDWLKTQLLKPRTIPMLEGNREWYMAEVGRVSRTGATLNAAARTLQPSSAVKAAA